MLWLIGKKLFFVEISAKFSAQGKGYENIEHYTKCQFQFLGIENIHVMRKSLEKLETEGWLKADWLNHVYAVLGNFRFSNFFLEFLTKTKF